MDRASDDILRSVLSISLPPALSRQCVFCPWQAEYSGEPPAIQTKRILVEMTTVENEIQLLGQVIDRPTWHHSTGKYADAGAGKPASTPNSESFLHHTDGRFR